MKTTTKAIVLHLTKYTDRASLLHVYSKNYGRITYIVYGSKSKKNNGIISSFQPLTIVEIEATHTFGREIQKLNTININYIADNIFSDVRRRTIAIFISEIIYRTLRHPEPDENLFNFLEYTIKTLDEIVKPENIHIWFLLNFTHYLGIMPSLDEKGKVLDIITGQLCKNETELCFSFDETELLSNILQDNQLSISRFQRQRLIEKLCMYYEYHLTDFSMPKSLEVLKDIFD